MVRVLSVVLIGLWSASAQACESLTLYDNIANGKLFEMTNSSKWKVTDEGTADTRIWSTGDEIENCDDGTLLNVDAGERVEAKRIK
jgi:hypothetical protein